MPKIRDIAEALRVYAFHGVDIFSRASLSGDEVSVDCVFCGREEKLYINSQTGQWQCKVCTAKGNNYEFLRLFWKHCDTTTNSYDDLSTERGFLFEETPMYWGLCRSTLRPDWLAPGYNLKGDIIQLYCYAQIPGKDRKALQATPTLHHGLFGLPLFDPSKPDLYWCESLWDAIALWEVLGKLKHGQSVNGVGTLEVTGSESSSLLGGANVLASPGCNVFHDSWRGLCEGKRVFLVCHNDHPRKHPTTGADIPSTSYEAAKKVAGFLLCTSRPPSDIQYLCWGEHTFHEQIDNGYDVRDHLKIADTLEGRAEQLNEVLKRFVPIPESWYPAGTNAPGSSGSNSQGQQHGVGIQSKPCSDWNTLVGFWQKGMEWTTGLDCSLSVMLASAASTKTPGDQIWIKLLGPASCGKTILCEALSVAKRFVYATSTMRGFHSGFRAGGEHGEDNSLIKMVRDKTLIIKDGDTLLTSPNLPQILAEARDLYDRVTRSHYRTGMRHEHLGVCMTWILSGTEALRQLDGSELGERMLTCRILDHIIDDIEDDINWHVINRVRSTSKKASNCNGDLASQLDPNQVEAMQLTGGYVEYLRQNAPQLLEMVEMSDDAARRCMTLGKFVSYMRARPSVRQEEDSGSGREMSPRLVSQLSRLAMMLAVVLNRKHVDQEVLRRVSKVAIDTARGRTLTIVEYLHRALSGERQEKVSIEKLVAATAEHHRVDKQKQLVYFLRSIGAVEWYHTPTVSGLQPKVYWRLTERMQKLYQSVIS